MMVWITNRVLGDCALVWGLPTYFGFQLSFSPAFFLSFPDAVPLWKPALIPSSHWSSSPSVSSNVPPHDEHELCPSRYLSVIIYSPSCHFKPV